MKRAIYSILIASIVFFGLQSIDSYLYIFLIDLLEFFTYDIARSYNSIIEMSTSDLGIKILIQKGFGASSVFNIIARTNMHLFFPISIFAGICFSKLNKKSFLLFLTLEWLVIIKEKKKFCRII